MIEKITALFNNAGKEKIVFEPAIRVQMTPHRHPTWIDKIYLHRGIHMISISNQKDKMIKSLNSLDGNMLNSIHIRLHSLYGIGKK